MNMPGFTAEASLNASRRYHMERVAHPIGEGVAPQATAVPDWIMEFWYATGGGGGGTSGGGGGGGFGETSQQCVIRVEAALDACRRGCWFGDPVYNPEKSRQCERDCYARYNVNNCFVV